MEEILHYLKMKNEFYEKFYQLTKKFLTQVQKNQWEGLELFMDNRERVLSIIKTFDLKMGALFEQLHLNEQQVAFYKIEVKDLLNKREKLVQKIVALDLEILPLMEEIKSETIQELKKNIEIKQQIDSFLPPRHSNKIRNEV